MKAHLTLTFALLILCTGAALAQTPAEETVCDNETGAAFGLCNAYCEAMDCDSDAPQASDSACSKVQAKFQQITGYDLPCETPAICPCAASPLWDTVVAGTPDVCQLFEGDFRLFTSTGTIGVIIDLGCFATDFTNEIFEPITPAQYRACVDLARPYCPPV